jgi:hypothetical protein
MERSEKMIDEPTIAPGFSLGHIQNINVTVMPVGLNPIEGLAGG